jgi:hypothetical protein
LFFPFGRDLRDEMAAIFDLSEILKGEGVFFDIYLLEDESVQVKVGTVIIDLMFEFFLSGYDDLVFD